MGDNITIVKERIEAAQALLEEVKDLYRKNNPGCCKILSLGDFCRCALCLCDEIHKLIGDAHRIV